MHVTDRIGPFDLRRGPWSGLRVVGELFRLPSGDWQVDLTGTSITGRMPDKTAHLRYLDVRAARAELKNLALCSEELSRGSVIDPITAY